MGLGLGRASAATAMRTVVRISAMVVGLCMIVRMECGGLVS